MERQIGRMKPKWWQRSVQVWRVGRRPECTAGFTSTAISLRYIFRFAYTAQRSWPLKLGKKAVISTLFCHLTQRPGPLLWEYAHSHASQPNAILRGVPLL